MTTTQSSFLQKKAKGKNKGVREDLNKKVNKVRSIKRSNSIKHNPEMPRKSKSMPYGMAQTPMLSQGFPGMSPFNGSQAPGSPMGGGNLQHSNSMPYIPPSPMMNNPAMGNPMMPNPAMGNPMMPNPMMGNPMMGNPMMGNNPMNPVVSNPYNYSLIMSLLNYPFDD